MTYAVGWLGTLLAVVCLVLAVRAARRKRLVDNLPTSKTTGVFIGLVELKGTAEAEQPLFSFLAGQPCVHYAWTIAEHWSRTVVETYTDSDGKQQTRTRHESGWTDVGRGGEQIPFYLRDDCGIIRVCPARAEIEPQTIVDVICTPSDPLYYGKGPAGAVSDSDHQRRFHEQAISLHAPLYIVGQARERADIVAAEVAHDHAAPLFLISTRSEAQVSSGYRWQFWLLGLLGGGTCVGGWMLEDHVLKRILSDHASIYGAIGAGYLVAWALTWAWMAYNSLVGLRQRVRHAWANVDVQLKRRNDLIPNLVRAVEGLRDYERALQAELAGLRSQLSATAPGLPGPDPTGCAVHIRAIMERYPKLRANEAFMSLQSSLVDTEQRISLARGYFNDSATFYNTRLEVVPDRFLAALAGMRLQPLITATDFERATVQVTLFNSADASAAGTSQPPAEQHA